MTTVNIPEREPKYIVRPNAHFMRPSRRVGVSITRRGFLFWEWKAGDLYGRSITPGGAVRGGRRMAERLAQEYEQNASADWP